MKKYLIIGIILVLVILSAGIGYKYYQNKQRSIEVAEEKIISKTVDLKTLDLKTLEKNSTTTQITPKKLKSSPALKEKIKLSKLFKLEGKQQVDIGTVYLPVKTTSELKFKFINYVNATEGNLYKILAF